MLNRPCGTGRAHPGASRQRAASAQRLVLVAAVLFALALLLPGPRTSAALADDGYTTVNGSFSLHARYFDTDQNNWIECALPCPLLGSITLPANVQTLLATNFKRQMDDDWSGKRDQNGKTELDRTCEQIKAQTAKSIGDSTGQTAHDISCNMQTAGELQAKVAGNHLLLSYLLRGNNVGFSITTPDACVIVCVGLPEGADPRFNVRFDTDLVIDLAVPAPAGPLDVQSAIVHTENAYVDSANISGDLVKDVNSIVQFVGGTGIFPPAERRLNEKTENQTMSLWQKIHDLTAVFDQSNKYGFNQLDAQIDAGSGAIILRLTHPIPDLPNVRSDTEAAPGIPFFSDPPVIFTAQTQVHAGGLLGVNGQKFAHPTANSLSLAWDGTVSDGFITDSEIEWGPRGGALRRDTVQRQNYDAGGYFTAANLAANTAYRFHVRNCELVICSPWSAWVVRQTVGGSDTVALYLDGQTAAQKLGDTPLGQDGAFATTVALPGSTAAGQHTVIAVDGTRQAQAVFTVVAVSQSFQPVIRVVGAQAAVPSLEEGDAFILHGEGFAPGQVAISLDSAAGTALGTATAGSDGAFQVTLKAPTGSYRDHTLVAHEDAGGGKSVDATLAVYIMMLPR